MDALLAAATLTGALAIAFTALPLVRASAWWIRVFDFPRLQISALGAGALAGLLLAWDRASGWHGLLGTALAGALGYQAWMMFPYTVLARKQVLEATRRDRGRALSLVFANVRMQNRDAGRLLAIIAEEDPDLVLAAEPDAWWQEQLDALARDRPYAVRQAQDNTYGMLLYSRLELIEPQVKFLVQEDVPSIHAKVRLGCGILVELRCLHPRPPTPPEAEDSKPRDRELIVVARDIASKDVPVIVLGDLNDVAWSRTNSRFRALTGLLDPRIGRGFYHTFHARYPFLRYPLDHCFHSEHFRLLSFRRLRAFGSDHFPVCIRLSYEPD